MRISDWSSDGCSSDLTDAAFAEPGTHWDRLDFLVHAIAFSDRAELTGEYVHTSRGNFQRTMDVSCYSLTAVCQRAMKLMSGGGSVVTLTYYGAEREIGSASCRERVCQYV